MAGMLSDVLDWMESPKRTQQAQMVGKSIRSAIDKISSNDKEMEELKAKAFGDPENPFKVTNKEALAQITDKMMAGPMGIAPAGMIRMSHGSPALFDHFNYNPKVGAFGRGHYTAEGFNSRVAQDYTPDDGWLYNIEAKWANPAKEAADPLGFRHYIDWDKPLGAQNDAIKQAIEQTKQFLPEGVSKKTIENLYDPTLSVNHFLYQWEEILKKEGAIEPLLAKLGVPGHRYRDAGRGTANFVTYPGNEDLLNIVGREQPFKNELLK